MKGEYLYFRGNWARLSEELDSYGQEGWELVSVLADGPDIRLLFKKQKA